MIGLVELKERWFEQGFNHTRNWTANPQIDGDMFFFKGP